MKTVKLKQKLTMLYKLKLKNFLNFYLLVFIMGVFSYQNIYAQENCAAQENLSLEELNIIKDNISKLSRKSSASARTTYQIPLQFIIVNNGSTPPVPGNIIESLPGRVETINSLFTNDMEFYICNVEEINSPTYYDLVLSGTNFTNLYNLFHADDAINVYIVDSLLSTNGSRPTGFSAINSSSKQLFITGYSSNNTLVHELGHQFSLLHTHTRRTETIIGSNGQDSLIAVVPLPSEPCDGDNICDTPVDPGTGNCTTSCSAGNCSYNGYTYSPDRQNTMSYYEDACGNHFSSVQLTVMQNNLLTEPNKAYLLTAPTSCVPFLIADEGQVEKVANFSGTSTIPIRLTDVIMTESGNGCTEETNGSYPNYNYSPSNCGYLLPENATVQVEPQRDKTNQWDNPTFAGKNGLDIDDTQAIQNHILGNTTLGLPYAQLAADVNRSGAITSYDNFLIRRVILDNDDTFSVTGS